MICFSSDIPLFYVPAARDVYSPGLAFDSSAHLWARLRTLRSQRSWTVIGLRTSERVNSELRCRSGGNRAREACDSPKPAICSTKRLSPTSRALPFALRRSWSSASLHPRLYAFAALRGLVKSFQYLGQSFPLFVL